MEKNILVIVNTLKIGGGAERIAAEVGSNLYEKGHNITFLTLKETESNYEYKGELISLEEKNSQNSYPLEFTFKLLKRAKEISKICKEREIDTIISFLMIPNLSSVLSKILFRHKAKVIVSVRNNPLKIGDNLDRILVSKLYPRADNVVVQTEKIQDILKEHFSIKNTSIIPNMVDLNKYQELARENVKDEHKDIFDDDFIFISVGSLTEQKAHWHMIRCFKHVTDIKRDTKLIFLGNGPLKNKLVNLSNRMGIDDRVFFLGKVDNIFPYLKKSDCFVLSSLYEGFPNVLLEALSQNLPIISTDCVSGPREILCPELKMNEDIEYPHYCEYGILTKPFNPLKDKIFFKDLREKTLSNEEKVFVESLTKLMENRILRNKYLNGLERVEKLDINNIIKRWESLI